MILYVIRMSDKTRFNSEVALLQKLRHGKSQAVKLWYRKYYDELYQYVAYKVEKHKDIEEVVQETYINCLKHVTVFKGEASIATWMKSIARHEIADFYRKKYAKKALETIPLHKLCLGEKKRISQQELTVKVKKVLNTIRGDYKELLLLKYVDQKKVKTIAQELGRSYKSVEADLFRAREDFKEVYATLE